jgi:hypothetical protein
MASHGRRFLSEPVAAKVPEITLAFWVIKLLTTAGGEATSDYLSLGSHVTGAAVEIGLLAIGLIWQFRVRRYTAAAYWFLAYAIAIFGTGVSDTMHLVVGIPYAGTTLLWAVVLAGIFTVWYRSERTLSIHSIVTRRREAFYWATVFATFALGTALGDFTATTLAPGVLVLGRAVLRDHHDPRHRVARLRPQPRGRVLVGLRGDAAAGRVGRRLRQQGPVDQRPGLRRRPHGTDRHRCRRDRRHLSRRHPHRHPESG